MTDDLHIQPCPVCTSPVTHVDTPSPGTSVAQPCGNPVVAVWNAGGVQGVVRLLRVAGAEG